MKHVPKVDRKFQTLWKVTHGELFNNQRLTTGVQALVKDLYGRENSKVGERRFKDNLILVKPRMNRQELQEIPRQAIKKSFRSDESFHEAVSLVFLVAQFFSFMPLKGVSSNHPRHLSFSWWNLRTWYSLLCIALLFVDFICRSNQILNSSITFQSLALVIYSICCFAVAIGGLNLSRKWPDLMMKWYEAGKELSLYQGPPKKRDMNYKIKMVSSVVLLLTFVQEVLYCILAIEYSRMCFHSGDPFKDFASMYTDHIFQHIAYSKGLACAGLFEYLISVFLWSYTDVFLIIVSIGLSSNFKRINDNLLLFNGMQMPADFWAERRIQYRKLCILFEHIDNAISVFTLISFANNIFFVCATFFFCTRKTPTVVHAVYFYFLVLFFTGRTVAVTLFAADVHAESRKPLRILRCVPKDSWTVETKRFAAEINNDFVALSGMKLFHVTRTLILTVAAAIVTYELVLIQFNKDGDVDICDTF